MSKKNPAAAKTRDLLHREEPATADSMARIIDRQMDFLRAYKTRQDDVVRGLGRVQKFLELGSYEAAKEAMAELMARDLKQAKDRQDNHAFALSIAVKALESVHDGLRSERDCVDALSQIEILVPEAFVKDAAPPAEKAAA